MLRVLFKLIVMHPERMLTHLSNYADFMTEEFQHALVAWRAWLWLHAMSWVCLGLSLASAVGALLLWAALPVLNPDHAWVMLVLPIALAAMGLLLQELAKRYKAGEFLANIHEQIKLDMLAICQDKDK